MPKLELSLLSNTYLNQLPAAFNAVRRRGGQVTHSLTTELDDKSLLMFLQFQVEVRAALQAYTEALAQEVTDESYRGLLNRWSFFANEGAQTPEQDRYEVGAGLPVLEARVLLPPAEKGSVTMHLACWMQANSLTLHTLLHRVEELGLHLEHLHLGVDDVTPGYRELTLRCRADRFYSALPEQLCQLSGVLYARVQSDEDIVEFLHRGAQGTMVLSPMIARDLGANLSLLEEEVL